MLIGREQEQEMLHKLTSQIAHSLLQCMVEDVWARLI